MKIEWKKSQRASCCAFFIVLICIYMGLLQASADLAIGAAGSGDVDLGQGMETISVTPPADFAWSLVFGRNNETSKSVSITVTDYNQNIYLKVHDASTPSGGIAGHMYSNAKGISLEKPLWIGEKNNPASMVALSDNQKRIHTFTNTPGTVSVPLDFGQATGHSDKASDDYAITVTFTCTATA